jgi:hypothetical protein
MYEIACLWALNSVRILRGKHRMIVAKNRVLKKGLGPKGKRMTGN